MKTLLFLIAGMVFHAAHAKDVRLIYRNNSAVGKAQKERLMDAYGEFVGLLAKSPFDPTLQFNVGSTLYMLAEKDKAETLYKQLLGQTEELMAKSQGDPKILQELAKVRFGILYNLGVLYQEKKEVPLALENYQAALELVPDSHEIKTNIEMMLASGGGGGKGDQQDENSKEGDQKDKDKQDQKGDQKKDQQDPKDQKDKKDQSKGQKKEFDQKQMSMEDLKRIMEELKQQEQGIRAKVHGKGGKDGGKEKEW